MSKSIKISSNQGGPFNAQQNLIDFSFGSEGGSYDLSQSYVNIMSQCVSDNSGNAPTAIYNCRLDYQLAGVSTGLAPPPISFVKNCSLKCQRVGELENIRRVDVLRTNLKPLTQTIEEYNSELYKTTGQTFTRSQASYSPWRELHGQGSIPSSNLVAPVQIKLSDLFELGNAVVDCKKLGEMRIHLELQNRVVAVQTPKSDEPIGNLAYQLFQDVSQADQPIITTITTLETFTRMEDCPYWVGMHLNVSGTGGGGAADMSTDAVITDITHLRAGANKGKVQLTFNKTLDDISTAGMTQTDIKVVSVNATSIDFQMDYAELVLKQVEGSPMEKMDDMTYTTYSLQETNGNSLLDFNEQFWVEGSAYNLITLPIDSDNDLLAGVKTGGSVVSSRWTVNGVDATDRNIAVDKPLYYDRVMMTLVNDRKIVKSLVLAVPDATDLDTENRWGNKGLYGLLFQPVPISNNKKSCNLQLSTTAGVEKVMVYKQLAKTVKV